MGSTMVHCPEIRILFRGKKLHTDMLFITGIRLSIKSGAFTIRALEQPQKNVTWGPLLTPTVKRGLNVLGEEYNACSSALRNFLHSSVTSTLLTQNVLQGLEATVDRCGVGGSMRAFHTAGPGSILGQDKLPGCGFSHL